MNDTTKIEIDTPCGIHEIENAVTTISHAGGCMDCAVHTEENKIVFLYKAHKH